MNCFRFGVGISQGRGLPLTNIETAMGLDYSYLNGYVVHFSYANETLYELRSVVINDCIGKTRVKSLPACHNCFRYWATVLMVRQHAEQKFVASSTILSTGCLQYILCPQMNIHWSVCLQSLWYSGSWRCPLSALERMKLIDCIMKRVECFSCDIFSTSVSLMSG